MHFRIADTFTDSLVKLEGDEQKAAKTTAFDLQVNPTNPGLRFHKLDRAKDSNFWSVRVNRDVRLIVHRTDESLMLCYVDHHDEAYRWAERRKLERHPRTGAAQLVEIREWVEEITIPKYVEREEQLAPRPPVFQGVADEQLLEYGVPAEWLPDVKIVDEDGLLNLVGHLPSEAGEALLELATGGQPKPLEPAVPDTDPFEHPDAQRRFRIMHNVEELEQALEYPWERWSIFLHPEQRELVERDYNGPARVAGSAGTGKTVVALHRAVYLARQNPDARVLLTTFSDALANVLRPKLRRLIGNKPRLRERVEIHALDGIGERLHQLYFVAPNVPDESKIVDLLNKAAAEEGVTRFSSRFLLSEWEEVVDAWQLTSWQAYRDVRRLGRKIRLPENQRAELWRVFSRAGEELKNSGLTTRATMFARLTEHFAGMSEVLFDFIVVDEAQDVSVPQLCFLAALGRERPNAMFFAGDLGQRIFQPPFSWKSLGIDVRGRSRTLHINYRTSHQIREQADRLLGPKITDMDGVGDDRRGTVSVFNGPAPAICTFDSVQHEIDSVAHWLGERLAQGVSKSEIAIFVRSPSEISRASEAVAKSGLSPNVLDRKMAPIRGHISIATMHLAKGMEFRAVAVMSCDDEVLPLQERIESVGDESDLKEIYETERHLLYVACTRARDYLWVSGVEPESEFLNDLAQSTRWDE
jgi:superfamily I DNA/RNA helicase